MTDMSKDELLEMHRAFLQKLLDHGWWFHSAIELNTYERSQEICGYQMEVEAHRLLSMEASDGDS